MKPLFSNAEPLDDYVFAKIHREALKDAFELISRKDYSDKWHDVLHELADGYYITLSKHIVLLDEHLDNYGEGRLCLAYVQDTSGPDSAFENPLCIIEAPKFGKKGSKDFIRDIAYNIGAEYPFMDYTRDQDEDDDKRFDMLLDFVGGVKNKTNWEKHARFFIPVYKPSFEDEVDFFRRDGHVNLETFCKHYGLQKEDIVGVEDGWLVYIRPESLKKLKRGIDDTQKAVGNDERSNEEKKAENDEVHAYLSERGYIGGFLWKDRGCDGFVFENDASKEDVQKYVEATLKNLSFMGRDLFGPKDWLLLFGEAFMEEYKELLPDEAARHEVEWNLFKIINRNAKA